MKYGTNIMGVSLRHFPEVARAYEDSGFESIWMPEHLVFPAQVPSTYPYSEDGEPPFSPDTPAYDPWVIYGFVACATTTIRMATNVFVLPLRHPLQTARSLVTLDRVSRGRVTLGAGIGWLEEEFLYTGLDFAQRGRRMDACVDAIRRLWTEDVIEVHDEFFNFGPVKFNPKPLQRPSIPIEIGGASPPALKRAGRTGDGWIEVGCKSIAELEQKLDVVLTARAESGREGAFEVTVMGPLAEDRGNDEKLAKVGVTRVIVDPRWDLDGRLGPVEVIEWARRFGNDFINVA